MAPLAHGLGFIPGSACPHYLGEPGRREAYQRWVSTGAVGNGYVADDFAAVIWRDGEFVETVAEQTARPVFRVERTPEGVTKHEVPVRLLVKN